MANQNENNTIGNNPNLTELGQSAAAPQEASQKSGLFKDAIKRILGGNRADNSAHSTKGDTGDDGLASASRRKLLQFTAATAIGAGIAPFLPEEKTAAASVTQPQEEAAALSQELLQTPEILKLPTYTDISPSLNPLYNVSKEVQSASTENWTITKLEDNPGFNVIGPDVIYYEILGKIPRVFGAIEGAPELVDVKYNAYTRSVQVLNANTTGWVDNPAVYANFEEYKLPDNITGTWVEVEMADGTKKKVQAIHAFTSVLELGIQDTTGQTLTFVDYGDKKVRTITTVGREIKLHFPTGATQLLAKHLIPQSLRINNQLTVVETITTPELLNYKGKDVTVQTNAQVEPNIDLLLKRATDYIAKAELMLKVDGAIPDGDDPTKTIIQAIFKSFGQNVGGLFFGGQSDTAQVPTGEGTPPETVPSITFVINSLYIGPNNLGDLDTWYHEGYHSLDHMTADEKAKMFVAGEMSSLEEGMATLAMFLVCYLEGNPFFVDRGAPLLMGEYLSADVNSFTKDDYFLFILPFYLINKLNLQIDPIDFLHGYLEARKEITAATKNGENNGIYNSTDPAHAIQWMLRKQQGIDLYAPETPLLTIRDVNRLLLIDLMHKTLPTSTFFPKLAETFAELAGGKQYSQANSLITRITPEHHKEPVGNSWCFRDVGRVKSFILNFYEATATTTVDAAEVDPATGAVPVKVTAEATAPVGIDGLHIFLPFKNEDGSLGYREIITNKEQPSIDLTEAIHQAQESLGTYNVRMLILNDTKEEQLSSVTLPPAASVNAAASSAESTQAETSIFQKTNAAYIVEFMEEIDPYLNYLPLIQKS